MPFHPAISITNFRPIRNAQSKSFEASFDFEVKSASAASANTYKTGGLNFKWEDYSLWPKGYRRVLAVLDQPTKLDITHRSNGDKLIIFDESSAGVEAELSNNTNITAAYKIKGKGYVKGVAIAIPKPPNVT